MSYVHYTSRQRGQLIARARKLRAAGATYRSIGRQLDKPHTTIMEWLDPDKRVAYNVRRAEHNCSPTGLRKRRERKRQGR